VTDATAAAAGTITNLAANGIVNLQDGDLDLTVDGVSGNVTVNVGSASGSISISALSVTDFSSVTITGAGSGNGTQTIASVVANTATTVTLSAAGSANLTVTEAAMSAASTVNLNAGGSAALNLSDALGGSALAAFNISAAGSDAADVVFASGGVFGNGSGGSLARTLTILAVSGADVTLVGVSAGSATYSASGTVATGTLNPTLVINTTAGNGYSRSRRCCRYWRQRYYQHERWSKWPGYR